MTKGHFYVVMKTVNNQFQHDGMISLSNILISLTKSLKNIITVGEGGGGEAALHTFVMCCTLVGNIDRVLCFLIVNPKSCLVCAFLRRAVHTRVTTKNVKLKL